MSVLRLILSAATVLVFSLALLAQGGTSGLGSQPTAEQPSAAEEQRSPTESAVDGRPESDTGGDTYQGDSYEVANHGDSSVEDDRSCVHLAFYELADDRRTQHIRDFLDKHSCQIVHLAPSFVLAAELNGLDYRLLPTLAVLESGCGRATKNYNLFGWANGRKVFASFEQGIHFVAQRLRLAPHYRNKTTIEKLRLYNRRASYRAKVLRLMESIGAGEGEAAGSTDKSRRTASGRSR